MSSAKVFPVRVKKGADGRWGKVPAIPKGTSWITYEAEPGEIEHSDNIGIIIPQGVIVIDLDTHKGVTPEAVEAALGCQLDWEGASVQKTLSGGAHYAFAVPFDLEMRQGSDLLGVKGFDTRASGRGWICSGKGYTPDNMGFCRAAEYLGSDMLPALPDAAVAILTNDEGGSSLVEVDALQGLEMAISAQPLDDIGEEEMRRYLAALPDDCLDDYQTWVDIGMACHHQTQGSKAGLAMWRDASARSAKYQKGDAEAKWASFGKRATGRPKTFAYVIHLAGGRGALGLMALEDLEEVTTKDGLATKLKQLAAVRLDAIQLEQALKQLQTQYLAVTGERPSVKSLEKEIRKHRTNGKDGEFVNDFVFMTSSGEYMHRETKAVMGPRAFNVANSRFAPYDAEGLPQSASAYADNLIEVVEGGMYLPTARDIFSHAGLEYINLYCPPVVPVQGRTDIVERVKGHIAHLLEDEREQQIVIDYLAHNVQFPGAKLSWAIVLQGVQGDGKSLLAEMMAHVMGHGNVRIMNVQTLESSFTGWATGQAMTFIEELKLDNLRKYEVLNNLKPYISNPYVEEHRKGKDPRSVINTTNYFALTNFKDAIPIDISDRRYCILFSKWQRKEALEAFMDANPSYYPALYDDMRSGAGELREWLLGHEISQQFLAAKRAPNTRAKELMTELSKSSAQVAVEEAIERFHDQINLGGGEIDITKLGKIIEVEAGFTTDNQWQDYPKTTTLKNCLMNMGYEFIGRKRTKFCEGDNKHSVYSK